MNQSGATNQWLKLLRNNVDNLGANEEDEITK